MQYEWGDCDLNKDGTNMSFNETTGTLSLQTIDQVKYPPGFYYFNIKARIGPFAIYATHVIHLIDPCVDLELDIVKPKTFIDQNYFLRDPELKYSWTQDSLIWKNTDVKCGNLIVDFTMNDGSEINRDIFKIDD